MKKVSKFRFHVILLLFLYLGVASFVVWRLPVLLGHVVMMAFAVWSFVVAWQFPRRHRQKRYSDSTPELEAKIERFCKAICVVLALIIMAHAAIVGLGWTEVFGYYVAEAIALILLIFVLFRNESETDEESRV